MKTSENPGNFCGIFYFGLNRKNPEIPGIRIGIWKFRKNPEWKIPKIPKSRGSGSGFEIPEKIPKTPRVKNPENLKMPGNGIRFLGFLILGIPDFLSSWYPQIGIFLRVMGYPDKKPPLVRGALFCTILDLCNYKIIRPFYLSYFVQFAVFGITK